MQHEEGSKIHTANIQTSPNNLMTKGGLSHKKEGGEIKYNSPILVEEGENVTIFSKA